MNEGRAETSIASNLAQTGHVCDGVSDRCLNYVAFLLSPPEQLSSQFFTVDATSPALCRIFRRGESRRFVGSEKSTIAIKGLGGVGIECVSSELRDSNVADSWSLLLSNIEMVMPGPLRGSPEAMSTLVRPGWDGPSTSSNRFTRRRVCFMGATSVPDVGMLISDTPDTFEENGLREVSACASASDGRPDCDMRDERREAMDMLCRAV